MDRTNATIPCRDLRCGRRRAPPIEAAPLRKKLGVKGARLVGAFGFVFGANGKYLAGIGGAKEKLAGSVAHHAGDLRGAGLGELGENAAAVDGQKRAIVAGSGEQTAIGIERQ